jgi:hypothetical protein
LGQVGKEIGLPVSTVENLDRRLGESQILPRARRGQRRALYSIKDLAVLIAGCLAVAAGKLVTESAIASFTQKVCDLGISRFTQAERFFLHSLGMPMGTHEPPCFVEVLSDFIAHVAANRSKQSAIAAIGLTISDGSNPMAWFELSNKGYAVSTNDLELRRDGLKFGAVRSENVVWIQVGIPFSRLEAIALAFAARGVLAGGA